MGLPPFSPPLSGTTLHEPTNQIINTKRAFQIISYLQTKPTFPSVDSHVFRQKGLLMTL